MIKVLELFAGIGACSKALERLGIEHEIVDAVEIDKYAIKSFNAIHGAEFEVQDITKWDKDVEVDLIMHGSPCQDFSVAGKQAGGDIGSGTRSSLMYETIRIVGKLRPKYVVWENVKNLLSKKHRHNFDAYIETMNILGYNSYYQVLNAKDYGIPQNRERVFTISIRKDIDKGNFEFPPKEELKLRLKDMLEEQVDEKYYLSDKAVQGLKKQEELKHKPNYIEDKEIVNTIDTKVGDGTHFSPYLRENSDPKCVRIGNIYGEDKGTGYAGNVWDDNGLSPALNTMSGGNRQPMILKEPSIQVLGNYMPSNHDASRIVDSDGLAPTVKENHGTVTAVVEEKEYERTLLTIGDNQIKIEDYPTIIQKCGDRGTNNYSKSNISYTIPSNAMSDRGQLLIQPNLRIRKLTPKECWRLMGFDDEDFKKAEKANSNTQLYKQAGNSIVVNVLEKIFSNLLRGE